MALVVTPALLRTLGPAAARLASVSIGTNCEPAAAGAVEIAGKTTTLDAPLELDAAMQAEAGEVLMTAALPDRKVPFLTRKAVGRGELLVLNVRTFTEQDFRDTGEWLLAPKRRGLPTIPQILADAIRVRLLSPLRVDFQALSGVQLVLHGKEAWVYSFRDENVQVKLGERSFELPAHQLVWLP